MRQSLHPSRRAAGTRQGGGDPELGGNSRPGRKPRLNDVRGWTQGHSGVPRPRRSRPMPRTRGVVESGGPLLRERAGHQLTENVSRRYASHPAVQLAQVCETCHHQAPMASPSCKISRCSARRPDRCCSLVRLQPAGTHRTRTTRLGPRGVPRLAAAGGGCW